MLSFLITPPHQLGFFTFIVFPFPAQLPVVAQGRVVLIAVRGSGLESLSGAVRGSQQDYVLLQSSSHHWEMVRNWGRCCVFYGALGVLQQIFVVC